MANPPVIYEKLDGMAKIWLNRPEYENRINHAVFLGFEESVKKALADPEVRVVIISAKGNNFCCGFDVGDTESSLNGREEGSVTWEDRRASTWEEMELWLKMLNSKKPTICAVKGRALGGGYTIAMLCDCIVAADNTVMDNGEFALGMSYVNYMPLELYKLPMNIGKEIFFTGYPITAKFGQKIGLFNRVVPVDQVDACAETLARRMLKLSPYTLSAHKELANMAYSMQGINHVIPFATECFNIGMHLPGTPENQAIWKFGKEHPGEPMVQLFEEKLAALRQEEIKELPHLDDLY